MIGTIVGSYKITGKIATGGMGTVYRAEHTLIGRIAAIKVLHPEMTQNRDIVQRFFNEAKATSTIKHPGIVEVYDFGHMPSGHAYIVMEYLEGQTLSQRSKQRGSLPEGEAAMLMRGVASALASAHAKGIVHRDLKPDNIFIVPEPESALGERTKILDFGIAKLTDVGLVSEQTKTGAVMGTPTYMSPEQCRGSGEVDHRADLYSIGCILYELVVGRPPFKVNGAGELLGCHLFVEPEPPSKHGPVSPELEGLIMRLLAKKPEDRPANATELAQELVAVAQALGWIAVTTTDPSGRFSAARLSGPIPRPTPAVLTPVQPAHLTPGVVHFTPGPSHVYPAHQAPTVIAPEGTDRTEKPTTLSGAASQSIPPGQAIHPVTPAQPRRGFAIAAGAIVLATAAGIAFVVGTSKERPVAASQPEPVEMKATTPTEPEKLPMTPEPVQPAPATAEVKDTRTDKVAEDNVATKDKDAKPAVVETKNNTETKDKDAKVTETKTKDTKAAVATTKVKDTKKTDKQTQPKQTPPPKGDKIKTEKVDKSGGDLLETDI